MVEEFCAALILFERFDRAAVQHGVLDILGGVGRWLQYGVWNGEALRETRIHCTWQCYSFEWSDLLISRLGHGRGAARAARERHGERTASLAVHVTTPKLVNSH